MARTDTLGHFLTDVADAIRTKKGTSDTIQASDFDTEIENLPSGSKYAPRYITFQYYTGTDLDYEVANLDISNMTSLSSMFGYCSNLVSLDLSSWDTSNITKISNMCAGCSSLKSINMDGLNLSNITNAESMFTSCIKLENLSIDFKNATLNLGSSCSSCTNLETLEIKNANATSMYSICNSCSSLKRAYLNTVLLTGIKNIGYAFSGCTSLEFLDIRTIELNKLGTNYVRNVFGSNASTYIPANCEIIVKDDDVKNWVLNNYSFLTNVKTVAEYEAEQSE